MAPKKSAKKAKPAPKRPGKPAARSIPVKTITPPPLPAYHGKKDDCCSLESECCGGASSCCSSSSFCHVMALYSKGSTWMLAVAAAFTLWATDFLWHGMILMPRYLETALLWRPEADMAALWPFCIAYHVIYALIFTSSFLLMGGKSWLKGIKHGVLIAAPLAASSLMVYVSNPAIPVDLLQMWSVGYLLQGAVTGLVLALVMQWFGKNGTCCQGNGSCC